MRWWGRAFLPSSRCHSRNRGALAGLSTCRHSDNDWCVNGDAMVCYGYWEGTLTENKVSRLSDNSVAVCWLENMVRINCLAVLSRDTGSSAECQTLQKLRGPVFSHLKGTVGIKWNRKHICMYSVIKDESDCSSFFCFWRPPAWHVYVRIGDIHLFAVCCLTTRCC